MKSVVLSIAGGIASALTPPSFAMDRVDSGEAIISENDRAFEYRARLSPITSQDVFRIQAIHTPLNEFKSTSK